MTFRVQFYVEDAMTMEYPDNFYDVVYSRDTILHIKEKDELFAKFLRTLKPGGRLLISDYCHGDQPHSNNFKEYVKGRDYDLHTVKEYGQILEQAGFKDVSWRPVVSTVMTGFECSGASSGQDRDDDGRPEE